MRQIRHIGLFVDDLETMRDFYMNSFDMKVSVHDTEIGNYISSLYGMNGNDIQVELYKLITNDECIVELLKIYGHRTLDFHSDQVFNSGCCHIAFTVPNVGEIYQKLRNNGITFYSEPLLSRDKKHMVCFCRDPEGNYLELVEELAKEL